MNYSYALAFSSAFLLICFLSGLSSVTAQQSFSIPSQTYGIAFGDTEKTTGIRFNYRDRRLREMNGLNITLLQNPNDDFNSKIRGLSVGLVSTGGRSLFGISIAPVATVFEDRTNGFTLGGIASVSSGFTGFQLGGIAAVSAEQSGGLQFGGLASVAGEDLRGLQLGGFAAVTGENLRGLQFGGMAAVAGENMRGGQIGLLAAVTGENVNGLQASGLAAVAGDKMQGFQFGGLAAVSGEGMRGISFSGLATVTGGDGFGSANSLFATVSGGSFTGSIFGGLFVAAESVRGLTLSGIVTAGGEFSGLQISGAVIAANEINGLTFTPVAVSGSQRGASVGLVIETNALRGIHIPAIYSHVKPGGNQNGGVVSLVNYNRGTQNGLSIGLLNYSRELRGVQFGLINIAGNKSGLGKVLPIINF
ncbi:MAG: hypothetical protein LAT67_01960 [Balneolales bacterium]|nr:hypothetical protein [Balneolales bacterium]